MDASFDLEVSQAVVAQLRAQVREVTAERDEARVEAQAGSEAAELVISLRQQLVASQAEARDLRAEVERLRAERDEARACLRASDAERDVEQARWQDRIIAEIARACPGLSVNGAGCESGDPLDFSAAELRQALNHLLDERDEARALVAAYRSEAEHECSICQHNATKLRAENERLREALALAWNSAAPRSFERARELATRDLAEAVRRAGEGER